ncbi:hypothetical protein M2305_002665 [Gluconobacter cerinus]|uniref:hypothetical protein n=1 Tax=Gluconobacter cerinus TaxID=38307 RepID=UPI002227DC1D|nr:hypothetical protein [Gluconobacter cerinus]MCW2266718.1 hypothetical protein [Gluconobacter cerinus]
MLFKPPLPSNLKASDPINLPHEYCDAIMWCLAARLAFIQAGGISHDCDPHEIVSEHIWESNTQIPTFGMLAILTPISNPFYRPGLEIQKL